MCDTQCCTKLEYVKNKIEFNWDSPITGVEYINLNAERGGFEPPVRVIAYDSLANCWFKPLTHLSIIEWQI